MSIPSRPAALLPAIALVAFVVAGCASAPLVSSSPGAASPAAAAPTPVLTPVPGGVMPPSDVPGAGLVPSEGEAMLLGGMRLDLLPGCGPVRDGLPVAAVAELKCLSTTNGDVAYVSVDLFDDQQAMLDAYYARLDEVGVEPMSNGGGCSEVEEAEGPWLPTDQPAGSAHRGACWHDDDGVPMAMLTEPPFLLVTVTGTPGNELGRVWQFAWLGNEDVPGAPTAWRESPVDDGK